MSPSGEGGKVKLAKSNLLKSINLLSTSAGDDGLFKVGLRFWPAGGLGGVGGGVVGVGLTTHPHPTHGEFARQQLIALALNKATR